jgi:hypothetical protein
MVKKGTTLYKLNKAVEQRGKELVELGYHNTMSDLVEHAVAIYIDSIEERIAKWQPKQD